MYCVDEMPTERRAYNKNSGGKALNAFCKFAIALVQCYESNFHDLLYESTSKNIHLLKVVITNYNCKKKKGI